MRDKRSACQLADIIRALHNDIPTIAPNAWKARTLYALMRCRTAEMGGHIDRCDNPDCKKLHLSYNSCRNRHCPRCQGHLRERWIQNREKDLLNASYFHVVFTLPDTLNELALIKPAELYHLLFQTAWSVVKDFAANPKLLGAKTGMVSVLHTWGQNLSLHPHLHCIVPAGGLTPSGKWKASLSKGRFLFPVKKMSTVFRARMVQALREKKLLAPNTARQLFSKKWVIYCKKPFFGPKQVIEYLGRYSHKIAISNQRIKSFQNGKVQFTIKNYRKQGKKETCTLTAPEFLRRFSLHILPKGFTRIRHYGILASAFKATHKVNIDLQIGQVVIEVGEKPDSLLRKCPCCKTGELHTVACFDQRGPPANWFNKIRKQNKKRQLA
ncbi:IS91 family transposase [Cyclobacterium amurskyense]|uniref:IS91 family transposase n=1 Tax=Cyclobacterium amurskyense TaxID=320787 RepID=UPI0030D9A665|tara:strand:+ start:956 stop:2101 length:1146 start_codon:yes stop_codon:yes gene_type:complete